MKSLIFLALLAFESLPDSPGATVQKISGIDVYVYASPSVDYAVVDKGTIRLTLTGGCDEVVKNAVKKAAKAGADGVLVDLSGTLGNDWVAIKYK